MHVMIILVVKIINSSLMIIKSQDVQCLQSFQYSSMVPMHSDSLPSFSKSEKETAYIQVTCTKISYILT